MKQQDMLEGELEPAPYEVKVVESLKPEGFHYAPAHGIYESFFEVEDTVKKDEPLGQVHSPERYDRAPEPVFAEVSGILTCRRFPGVTAQGDCVATIARPTDM